MDTTKNSGIEYVYQRWRNVRLLESNAGLGYTVLVEVSPSTGRAEWLTIGQDEIYQDAAWQAAYEFTLEIEEEIRRLKQDIAYMQERFADPFEDGWGEEEQPSANYQPERYEDGIEDWLFNNHTPPSDCDVREFVRDSYRAASIIQRLQQALAELERGFKEQEGSK